MKRCILHFGMPKTGSTSIQNALANSGSGVLPLECVRFSKKDGTQHGGLTNVIGAGWHDDPTTFRANRKRGMRSKKAIARRAILRQRLSESIDEIAGNGLVSAEGLCKVLSEPGLKDFSEWLLSLVESVTAVGYIRTPKSYMESTFQEALKHKDISNFNLAKYFPQYRKWFEKLEIVFGPENVQFWKFDPSTFPGGDVVHDFCARLGFNIEAELQPRKNEAFSLRAVRLLFAYRSVGPGFGVGPAAVRENHILAKMFTQLPGPKLRFASDLVEPLLEKHRSEIEWIEQRLGTSLHEDLVDTPDAVRSKNDLLKFDEESLRWLAEQLGPGHVQRMHSSMSPEEVAHWVHELRLKLSNDISNQRQNRKPTAAVAGAGSSVLTVQELVRQAKAAVPDLNKMKDDRAIALTREAFKAISLRIASTDTGVVSVGGLGSFRIRNVEKENDGKETVVKRVVFNPDVT